jgi:hypothetical protein
MKSEVKKQICDILKSSKGKEFHGIIGFEIIGFGPVNTRDCGCALGKLLKNTSFFRTYAPFWLQVPDRREVKYAAKLLGKYYDVQPAFFMHIESWFEGRPDKWILDLPTFPNRPKSFKEVAALIEEYIPDERSTIEMLFPLLQQEPQLV